MTSASVRTPTIAEPPRRAGLRLWMLVALVAMVGLPVGVLRRWQTFRLLQARHVAAAAQNALIVATQAGVAERYARSAELAETMAEKLGPLVGAEQHALAETDRIREREARASARSSQAAMDEEFRLANEFRNRW